MQSAIEQAQSDQEAMLQRQLMQKMTFVKRLQELFMRLDSSHDGTITLHEFQDHLQSEHMQALLQTFEIDNADAWTLFKLLDTDGGGSVDINEFVDGCIRLKGQAKSIQMAQLMYHHKWIMDKLVELSEITGQQGDHFKRLGANQKAILERLLVNEERRLSVEERRLSKSDERQLSKSESTEGASITDAPSA